MPPAALAATTPVGRQPRALRRWKLARAANRLDGPSCAELRATATFQPGSPVVPRTSSTARLPWTWRPLLRVVVIDAHPPSTRATVAYLLVWAHDPRSFGGSTKPPLDLERQCAA